MKRVPGLTLIVCGWAHPVFADDEVYRCSNLEVVAWQGVPEVSSNDVEMEPGVMEFTLDTVASLYQQYYRGEPIGAADQVEIRHWSGEGTRAVPQLVVNHKEGNFSLRIALDNDPLRFALLYPVSTVTGTCVIETESEDK